MIRVPVTLDRSFRLPADVETAFALLADIPAWGRLFPRVAALDPLPDHGPSAWRWRMEPMGPPGFEARTVYGCHYAIDADQHAVVWTPIPEVGNAVFEGAVRLVTEGAGTSGTMHLEADLEIPAPRFVRPLLQAQVAFEMGRMTDTFIGRVRDLLAGKQPE